MAVTFMKKNPYAIFEYFEMHDMVAYMKHHNVEVLLTMKGYLLTNEDLGVAVEVDRVLAQKSFLAHKGTKAQASAQIALFNSAFEDLKVLINTILSESPSKLKKGTPIPDSNIKKVKIGDTTLDKLEWGQGTILDSPANIILLDEAGNEVEYQLQKLNIYQAEGKAPTVAGKLEQGTKLAVSDETAGVAPSQPVGVLNPEKNMNEEKVPLLQATKLFQPVGSTSGGSVYYCVALGKKYKIGARMKESTSVSIRVEGDIDNIKDLLVELGVDIKSPKYASLHVQVKSFKDASKVVGSVICGLGELFHQTTHDFHSLHGKGI